MHYHVPRRAVLALLPLPFAGCVAEPPNPYPPPPPLRAEVVPPPRPRMVWEPGTWQWDGRAYVWAPGHYVERAAGGHWEHGHWAYRGGAWVWVPGGWM